MALHGEILVSGHVIGEWSAVRQQHPPGLVNEYKCVVEFRDINQAYHRVEFMVTHMFADGALALASHVLERASELIDTPVENPDEAKERKP